MDSRRPGLARLSASGVALVLLSEVLSREVGEAERRAGVVGGRYQGRQLGVEPLPRLSRLGRELDMREPLPAVLDLETPVLLLAALERSCVVESRDGERSVARVERLHVDPRDVRWRDAVPDDPRNRYAVPYQRNGEARARGRAAAAATKARQPAPRPAPARATAAPSPMPAGTIGVYEAARLAGVSKVTVLNWINAGRLAATTAAWGTRPVLRVRREDVLKVKTAPVTAAVTGA